MVFALLKVLSNYCVSKILQESKALFFVICLITYLDFFFRFIEIDLTIPCLKTPERYELLNLVLLVINFIF
jgi:hypothetical protein